MRILLINKFLYPNGGSETYIFKLGQQLMAMGHEVQYFGMEHEGRVVGNRVEAYTSDMDFHGGSKLSKLTYPIKTIYSSEARKKLRLVLEDFQPDVCHLNNFNYQLTPSIILEIRKWSKTCRIVYTAHDYQLVCPNHMCRTVSSNENCEKCLGGYFLNCTKGKCIHGSLAKSVIGTLEGTFWKWMGVYEQIDTIICISEFMKAKLDRYPVLADKTVVLHNFVEGEECQDIRKKDYVLYFGRFAQEKGIATLIGVAKELPDIPFIFAGSGPLEDRLTGVENIKNVGFQQSEGLRRLIREARFTVCPSEWYEPFGLTIAESIVSGTPVLGANIGGIPELIRPGETGALFESGNAADLKQKIEKLWNDRQMLAAMSETCKPDCFMDVARYAEKLMTYYC
jgi:glycosyltransferase involved in cell wall biosynthesis